MDNSTERDMISPVGLVIVFCMLIITLTVGTFAYRNGREAGRYDAQHDSWNNGYRAAIYDVAHGITACPVPQDVCPPGGCK